MTNAVNNNFYNLPIDVLATISDFADDSRISRTSKDLQRAVKKSIDNLYRKTNLPFPQTHADLQRFFQRIIKGGYSDNIVSKIKALMGSFRPEAIANIERERQAENDANLQKVWMKIREELRLFMPDLSANQIRVWLRDNEEMLSQIEQLQLSDLELTMIPEEFSSLRLPNLKYVSLSKNLLKRLPDNFGANWINLRWIDLDRNQLTSLPDNFGQNWWALDTLWIQYNHLQSLPDNFGNQWHWLIYLRLKNNHIRVLPEGFGSPWNWNLVLLDLSENQIEILPEHFGEFWYSLETLGLMRNRLRSLPAEFGRNWDKLEVLALYENRLREIPLTLGRKWKWWNEKREYVVAYNPLNSICADFRMRVKLNWEKIQIYLKYKVWIDPIKSNIIIH